jgi:hypothetical protein
MRVVKNMIIAYNNSKGGAHGKQGEAARRPNERANDAAPPRSEVLTRPLAGLRSSPLPPLVGENEILDLYNYLMIL